MSIAKKANNEIGKLFFSRAFLHLIDLYLKNVFFSKNIQRKCASQSYKVILYDFSRLTE